MGHGSVLITSNLVEIAPAESIWINGISPLPCHEHPGPNQPRCMSSTLDFQLDFARQHRIVEVSAGLGAQAATLARKLVLRGYDAVRLARGE
jgi:hypothetical protein